MIQRYSLSNPRSWRLLLILSSLLGLTALLSVATLTTPQPTVASGPLAIYLEPLDTPPALRLNVAPSALVAQHITVVRQVEEFQQLAAALRPQSLWINQAALAKIPPSWLREQLQRNIVIVGINVTKQELATVLGVDSGGEPAWRPTQPFFAIYYQASLPFTNRVGQPAMSKHRGWFNHVYEPEQPDSLFNWIREALQYTQDPMAR